jgi:N-acetylglucosaminyl-diphospho-decaprenol L-rhamnosyltransferase
MVPTPRPPVAVAVVSWNTRDLLRGCLASLRADHEAGRAAVWVVDNGSSDGSAGVVRDEFPWVELIEPGDNLGFGGAVNLVAARGTSEWIAPANADIALEPGALERLLEAADRDPQAGVLAPRLVLPDGTTQHSVHPFPTLGLTVAFNAGVQRVVPAWGNRRTLEGYWDAERERRVDWAVGAFLLVRRSAWDAAGGFDAHQWMYAEDLDLGWRLARAGHPTRYVPGARVHHNESAATAQAWTDRTERWMWSTYGWMLRRRGVAVTRAVAAVNVAGAAGRAAWMAPAAALAPRRWQAAARTSRNWARLHTIGLRSRDELLRHR